MNRRSLLLALIAVVGCGVLFPLNHAALAGEMSVFTGKMEGVAINGFDAVAYQTMNKPVEGSKDHAVKWNGVDWYFASDENRKLFEAEPEKYAPQYGGFCAFAAAQGQKAKSEPDAFTVVDGKLYLNYNMDVKAKWSANQSMFIKQADEKWPAIGGEKK